MKKLLFSILPLVIFLFSANGQDFNGGLYAGLNTSQVFGDGLGGFNKPGLYGGIFVSRGFGRQMGLSLEFSYIEKGSREKLDENSPDPFPYTLKANYLEVPILLYYKQDGFWFEFGPSFSYFLYGSDEDSQNNFQPTAQFEPTNLGFIIGSAYHLTDHIQMKVRYTGSILPFRKLEHAENSFWRRGGQYHEGLSFTLIYLFND